MRVLTLTTLYPNPYQPLRAPFTRQLVRALAERAEVEVIAPIAWTDELALVSNGARPLPSRDVVLDGIRVQHPAYLFPPRVFRGSYGACYRHSVRQVFERTVARFRPDVVFTPWAYPDGWAACHLGRRLQLPVVVKVIGSDVRLMENYPTRQRRTVEALRAADAVVAVSRELADRVLHMDVPENRVRVIYDGIDPTRFFPGPRADARLRLGLDLEPRLLLFVGNLIPLKGVSVLLRACARMARTGRRFACRVIGQGPHRPDLEAEAATLGLTDRVWFHGPLAHHELPDWFRAADVFVLPSYSEGVPSVLLESAGCALPFVASRVGGIPEIARPGIDRLVDAGDPEALAQAIELVLDGPHQRPDATPPRTWDAAAADLGTVFEQVIRRRAGHAGSRRPAGAATLPRRRGQTHAALAERTHAPAKE